MPYRTDPRLSGRHPFEIYMLALAAVTGIPSLFGAPEPGSIEAALPSWAVFAWSLVLSLGSVLALLGISLKRRDTGLILEQLGLAFVGAASIIYAVSLWAVAGLAALFAGGIVFGFGVSCLVRWKDLQETIDAVHEAEKEQGTAT